MTDYYVILTGSKNNAGDFLIQRRACSLLADLRPDREVISFNAWDLWDEKRLGVVNAARALILTGGPSVQSKMYGGIYKLSSPLHEIEVPILTMGVGWKGSGGSRKDVLNYKVSNQTHELLSAINDSGFFSSVRDYHTLSFLSACGYKNFLMTGCPAHYQPVFFDRPFLAGSPIRCVAFSLGVSFVNSPSQERLLKKNIKRLKHFFVGSDFRVIFHHSLDPNLYLNSPGAKQDFLFKNIQFSEWLRSEGIEFLDISGSAQSLISYYSNVDLHIGYRLHAHIFMQSINRKSILVAEDGRALAVQKVSGGYVIDQTPSMLSRSGFFRTLIPSPNRVSDYSWAEEVIDIVEHERRTQGRTWAMPMQFIRANYKVMCQFLEQLP